VLAQLARRTMRKKISVLEEAFTGYFTDHHAFLLDRMYARADAITGDITALDARIEAEIAPFAPAVRKLDEVPGISLAAAHAIIAETGLDIARFPTAGHLVSWAKYAPGVQESAGKKKGKNSTGHGNTYLVRILGNAAAAATTSASSKQSVIRSSSNAPPDQQRQPHPAPLRSAGCCRAPTWAPIFGLSGHVGPIPFARSNA
jgi:transposase